MMQQRMKYGYGFYSVNIIGRYYLAFFPANKPLSKNLNSAIPVFGFKNANYYPSVITLCFVST